MSFRVVVGTTFSVASDVPIGSVVVVSLSISSVVGEEASLPIRFVMAMFWVKAFVVVSIKLGSVEILFSEFEILVWSVVEFSVGTSVLDSVESRSK